MQSELQNPNPQNGELQNPTRPTLNFELQTPNSKLQNPKPSINKPTKLTPHTQQLSTRTRS